MGSVDPLQGALPKYQYTLSLTPNSGPPACELRGLEVNFIVVGDLAQLGLNGAPSRNICRVQVEAVGHP